MDSLPKKNYKDEDVFYGPLPVSAPEPILKPNEHIQLQPIVNPVAIVPYISYDNINGLPQSNQGALAEENAYDEAVPVKKTKNRVCGLIMLLISLLTFTPFVLALFNPYPLASLEKYVGVNNIIAGYKDIITNKKFTNLKTAFPVYLLTIGLISVFVNTIKSMIALIGGKRKGYGTAGVFVFVTFIVSALFYFGFGNIKNIAGITTYDNGWACLTLMILGAVNLIFAIICTLICPKQYKIDTVDF